MKIKWDQIGQRKYKTGIDHGVLYPQDGGTYPKGVAWNGLINVTETPSGAEDNPLYADNIKYLNLKSAEDFGLTIECYTAPDEWEACNGEVNAAEGVRLAQQSRNTFGLCYRTLLGNDTSGQDYGYELHLVYGCSASPSERAFGTVNDSPDALTFSYEISTISVPVEGFKPTSLITIDSTKVDKTKLAELEAILYGTDASDSVEAKEAKLPLPDEVIALFAAA